MLDRSTIYVKKMPGSVCLYVLEADGSMEHQFRIPKLWVKNTNAMKRKAEIAYRELSRRLEGESCRLEGATTMDEYLKTLEVKNV